MKAKISPTIFSVLLALLLTTVGFAQEEQFTPADSDDAQIVYKQSKDDVALEQQNILKQEAEKKRIQVLKERFAKANNLKEAKSAIPMMSTNMKVNEEMMSTNMNANEEMIETSVVTQTVKEVTQAQSQKDAVMKAKLAENEHKSKLAKAKREKVTNAVRKRLAKQDINLKQGNANPNQ